MRRGSTLNFVRDCDKLERVNGHNDSYYSRKETLCSAMRDILSASRSCDEIISVDVNHDMYSVPRTHGKYAKKTTSVLFNECSSQNHRDLCEKSKALYCNYVFSAWYHIRTHIQY